MDSSLTPEMRSVLIASRAVTECFGRTQITPSFLLLGMLAVQGETLAVRHVLAEANLRYASVAKQVFSREGAAKRRPLYYTALSYSDEARSVIQELERDAKRFKVQQVSSALLLIALIDSPHPPLKAIWEAQDTDTSALWDAAAAVVREQRGQPQRSQFTDTTPSQIYERVGSLTQGALPEQLTDAFSRPERNIFLPANMSGPLWEALQSAYDLAFELHQAEVKPVHMLHSMFRQPEPSTAHKLAQKLNMEAGWFWKDGAHVGGAALDEAFAMVLSPALFDPLHRAQQEARWWQQPQANAAHLLIGLYKTNDTCRDILNAHASEQRLYRVAHPHLSGLPDGSERWGKLKRLFGR